uniref:aECM cysteine-cradle domain-containing protein n=1 Tax=Acrobeloides nanus TaxID=290746 RepID=A0A914C3R2_9BILA
MQEIQRLQNLVNSGRSRSSRSSPRQKPKKYKCFLVDEDDLTFSNYAASVNAKHTSTLEPNGENLWPSSDQLKPQPPSVYRQSTTIHTRRIVDDSQDSVKLPVVHNLPIQTVTNAPRNQVTVAPHPIQEALEVAPPMPRQLRPLPQPLPEEPQIVTSATVAPLPIATSPPQTPRPTPNVPRDAQNRPLILSPEHCAMMKRYADLYGVQDISSWVHQNCGFAQLYLPTASCPEIDILVASCGY